MARVPAITDVVARLSSDWERHGVTDGFRFEGARAEGGSIERRWGPGSTRDPRWASSPCG